MITKRARLSTGKVYRIVSLMSGTILLNSGGPVIFAANRSIRGGWGDAELGQAAFEEAALGALLG